MEGAADLEGIWRLGAEEDYTINLAEPAAPVKITIFQVDGITCMDCAQKFEKAVNNLPGVTKANLNTMTGNNLTEWLLSKMSPRKWILQHRTT